MLIGGGHGHMQSADDPRGALVDLAHGSGTGPRRGLLHRPAQMSQRRYEALRATSPTG